MSDKATREPGYYWVNFNNELVTAEWKWGYWNYEGQYQLKDAVWNEIDERRIDRNAYDSLLKESKELIEKYLNGLNDLESRSNSNRTLGDKCDKLEADNRILREALSDALVTLKAFLPDAWATINVVESALKA